MIGDSSIQTPQSRDSGVQRIPVSLPRCRAALRARIAARLTSCSNSLRRWRCQPLSRFIRRDHERSPTRLALLAAHAISRAHFGCESRGPRCRCRYLPNNCQAMNFSTGDSRENGSSLLLRYDFSPPSLRRGAGGSGGEVRSFRFLRSLAAFRSKRQRCLLQALQVCQRPSRLLRSTGNSAVRFHW